MQKKKTKKEKQRAKKLAAKGGVGQPVSEDDKAPDVDDSPPSGMNTRHYLSTFLDKSPHYTSLFRGSLLRYDLHLGKVRGLLLHTHFAI